MKNKKYSIFGAGASGLYTAWRLLNGKPRSEAGRKKQLQAGDVLELYDWGRYDFTGKDRKSAKQGRGCAPGTTGTTPEAHMWRWAACATRAGTARPRTPTAAPRRVTGWSPR